MIVKFDVAFVPEPRGPMVFSQGLHFQSPVTVFFFFFRLLFIILPFMYAENVGVERCLSEYRSNREVKPVPPPKVKGESNSQTVTESMCLCGFCRRRGEF